MMESFSGPIRLTGIWLGLLFSILIHTALAALFLLVPFANSPMDQRCLEVQFVTLVGRGALSGNAGEWSDASSSATGEKEQEPSGGASIASGPGSDTEDTGEFRQTDPIPDVQRNVVSNPATGKPTAKPKSMSPRKTDSPSPQARQKADIREVGLGTAGAQKATGLSGSSVSQEEGSGRGAAGSLGDGTGYGPGSQRAGQGPSLSNGPIDAQLGSANGPRFLHRVLPRYPRLAREKGKEGSVLLGVTIDQQGRPVHVELLRTAGCEFDDEAVKAVESSTFTPARVDGRPVICKVLLPVRFELKGSEDD
jgi:protein TonB